MPKDYAETGMDRLRSALKGSFTPGSREWYADQIYGTGVPADVEQKRAESADFIASMTPGIGEGMALRDAWDASGRGGQALMQGDVGSAASEYLTMLSSLAGGLLPFSVQKLASSAMPSDPSSTTMIFAGPTAKTADHAALAKAQEMKAQGASRADIWRETGWDLEKGDQIPRFEIDDSDAMMGMVPMVEGQLPAGLPWLRSGDMSDLVDHPELYQAYPDLAKGSATISPAVTTSTYNRIGEGPSAWDAYTFRPKAINNPSVPLHELQHGVQQAEGFAQGTGHASAMAERSGNQLYEPRFVSALEENSVAIRNSPDGSAVQKQLLNARQKIHQEAAYDAYWRHAGEVEARNVQSRMNMNAAERRATPPWETQDVPDDQQIVRFR